MKRQPRLTKSQRKAIERAMVARFGAEAVAAVKAIVPDTGSAPPEADILDVVGPGHRCSVGRECPVCCPTATL